MTKRWEYISAHIECQTHDHLVSGLNEYGWRGWELIEYSGNGSAIFKREITDEEIVERDQMKDRT
jgi:hypothetical protein